ncbi:MAG: hypothetical protein NZ932_05635 [Candidatus Bathyarchaeota archaeon]|nr:hypothetical protein [Candidatus Bathyarchaeota archaeon]
MRKKSLAFAIWAITSLILALNIFQIGRVDAENTFTVEWITHKVEVLYNGYILINDTIKLGGSIPDNFLIGLPYQYGAHVLGCVAHPSANPMQRYNVVAGVPLEGRIGFYGVKVNLNPPPGNGVFSVFFVLSQSLLKQNAENISLFTLDFPAFPSLTVGPALCNASLVLPLDARYVSGTVPSFSYATGVALQPFTYERANVTFLLTTEDIQLFAVKEFKREIALSAAGEVTVSDSYYVKNQSPKEISSIEVVLLPDASDVTVEDEFGRKGETPAIIDKLTGRTYKVKLTFAKRAISLKSGEAARFIVKYKVPSNLVVRDGEGCSLSPLQMFQNVKYYIEEAWITLTFPEGAKITGLTCKCVSADVAYGTVREVFQEKIVLYKRGVLSLDSIAVGASYAYSILWLSFRPTLWAWALATFTCAVLAVWKKLKPPAVVGVTVPAVAVKLTPETVRAFVNSYEEKKRILAEIKSLEVAVSRGRIPRRRYKVQRRTLETRLATLSRNLNELKLKLRSAGGRYAELMHQLEVAETEINEAEANVRSIETRHRRGDLTLEAYRRLLTDYQRRREKAEAAINGILLRLREETH